MSPAAQNSQPIGTSRLRDTISTPTTVKTT
jgi:hypothetical protein